MSMLGRFNRVGGRQGRNSHNDTGARIPGDLHIYAESRLLHLWPGIISNTDDHVRGCLQSEENQPPRHQSTEDFLVSS